MNLPIAEIIRRLRTEKEVTQETLAAALGVTSQSVSRWENGNAYPDMELIPKIAMYFGVSIDVLFGMDDKARQRRLAYLKRVSGELLCEDNLRVTERQYQHHLAAHEEFPEEPEFADDICYDIIIGKIRPPEEHLDELRELTKLVAEKGTDQRKWSAIKTMIMAETEEHLQTWLDMLPKDEKDTALISRYRYREEPQKFNQQIQKTVLKELTHGLANFTTQYREDEFTRDSQLAIFGGHLALTILDLLRDPSTDDDAWILTRARWKLNLAAAYLAAGEDETGYTLLAETIDLLIHYHHLPRETVLSYNCPLFAGQNHVKAKEEWLTGCTAQTLATTYRRMTNDGQPLSNYKDDPRMQKQINRLLEYITEVDLEHCV